MEQIFPHIFFLENVSVLDSTASRINYEERRVINDNNDNDNNDDDVGKFSYIINSKKRWKQ